MRTRSAVCGMILALAFSAVVYAGVCPLCLQQIPDGEKYCERHKAELLAQRISSQEEKQLVDALVEARETYHQQLKALKVFYEERGNADGLHRVSAELDDAKDARKFAYQNWEDSLPELSATEPSPEADALLAEADKLRKSFNPFNRGSRLKSAAEKYQQILIDHPNSTAVDSAAFGLGEVYSSGAVGEYERAVKFYELAYLANPKTPHDTLYRAAQVCDSDLADYECAARFYWLAHGVSGVTKTRIFASRRLRQLQKAGFGTSYTLGEAAPAQDEDAAPTAE